jgi:hypothetical protein
MRGLCVGGLDVGVLSRNARDTCEVFDAHLICLAFREFAFPCPVDEAGRSVDTRRSRRTIMMTLAGAIRLGAGLLVLHVVVSSHDSSVVTTRADQAKHDHP